MDIKKTSKLAVLSMAICLGFWNCTPEKKTTDDTTTDTTSAVIEETKNELVRPEIYANFKLTTDISQLSESEKKMIPLLIEAAKIMDGLFWKQAYNGDKDSLLATIKNQDAQKFVQINYGLWDRLEQNRPFIEGVEEKPLGANFYPTDMTKEEYEAFEGDEKSSLYTLLRRDSEGKLMTVPYHKIYKTELEKTADYLRQAAEVAEDASLKKYLTLRADALVTDDYMASDMAWMDMKTNGIDIIIGAIETYEDHLFGQKAAFSSYVLVKDKSWSERLEKYAALLPQLQKDLPVEAKYKAEKPGSDSQLNAYDVVFYGGDCNAGSKTIAVNLPNDEQVQLKKGTRRSQLKNAMKAKFDQILLPISEMLITPEQRKHITFDAFFENTMFHEVAHGLGIKNTINKKGTVRESLKDMASALEEGKADVLGLYMVTKLREMGELSEGELMDNYTTFLAGIFRSVRFGAASAHGKANMIRFNFFNEKGAFEKLEDGTYKVNPEKMAIAVNELSAKIITLQGDGDYEGVTKMTNEMGIIKADLQADLDRLSDANIPVDIIFEQGADVLGL
ncbi:Peptidase family M49 [Bernardetia litoralis DSM 6794]|uniref:Peptidase family M49 n=1 Tax=Bernardetia litoralis (strain ATCC 23117 / DSM 6794 / NBRC 15988 / NCIMB 1366 / Fx l1 / Sio-4) TaxID=880071 RepID=I4AH59_BERLS|nr:peptidase M49 [Bernardetia litoralis]AFM03294.1 Peptidase family M49 [Bernardetia litoralis DSM 6794]